MPGLGFSDKLLKPSNTFHTKTEALCMIKIHLRPVFVFIKRNTYWEGMKLQKVGEVWSNGLVCIFESYWYIWFACPEFVTTKLFVLPTSFSYQLETRDLLPWPVIAMPLVKKSISGQHCLQVILRFSKLSKSEQTLSRWHSASLPILYTLFVVWEAFSPTASVTSAN